MQEKKELKDKPLHPRNRHHGRYDFKSLVLAFPELKKFVRKNEYGDDSIDFSKAEAVKALNKAILKSYYEISYWDIPAHYLCPPIPGRADYVHYAADLLASFNNGKVPQGKSIRVWDLGTGANVVYPIIGNFEYGWSFRGSDIDSEALKTAQKIAENNTRLNGSLELLLQEKRQQMFKGLIKADDLFDLTICNPPFHSSLEEAQQGSQRKWKNLGKKDKIRGSSQKAVLNFGGQSHELWCEGGEFSFIKKIMEESVLYKKNVFCFSSLVSKEANLEPLKAVLKKLAPTFIQVIEMAQGQKKSRFLAWSFLNKVEQQEWREQRWKNI